LIEEALYLLPGNEYNEVFESLAELYQNGEEFSLEIVEKIEIYNPHVIKRET